MLGHGIGNKADLSLPLPEMTNFSQLRPVGIKTARFVLTAEEKQAQAPKFWHKSDPNFSDGGTQAHNLYSGVLQLITAR